jgi:hypothetical protein
LKRREIKRFFAIYLPKYVEIEPYIMPFGGPYSRSGSGHFHPQQNTCPSLKNTFKTRLCERFILSVFENTADLRLFLNGA